jgi:hypothetical protein
LGSWVIAPLREQPKSCTADNSDHVFLQIFPLKTAGKKQVEIMFSGTRDVSPEEEGGYFVVDGYTTRLENASFLNLRLIMAGPEANLTDEVKRGIEKLQKAGYFFVAYRVERIASVSRLTFSADVMVEIHNGATAGQLSHAVLPGGSPDDVLITDSSDNIAKYISSLDETALFAHSCVFQKVE